MSDGALGLNPELTLTVEIGALSINGNDRKLVRKPLERDDLTAAIGNRKGDDHGSTETAHLQGAPGQEAKSPTSASPAEHLLRPLRRSDQGAYRLLELRLA
jgi:hypothetical protein